MSAVQSNDTCLAVQHPGSPPTVAVGERRARNAVGHTFPVAAWHIRNDHTAIWKDLRAGYSA